jgi:16S rRNA (adenine1518-N6/adenine1519-N6)-dimethyltransferase
MLTKSDIQKLLKESGVQPKKTFGQNFLISQNILEKIIAAAQIQSQDIVLEIGPGLGILTKELAKAAKKVIAVEKDPKLAKILQKILIKSGLKNVQVIQGDILKIENLKLFENLKLKITNYKVVSNLPYNIATEVVRIFLKSKNPPESMILMLQKEVGEKICKGTNKLPLPKRQGTTKDSTSPSRQDRTRSAPRAQESSESKRLFLSPHSNFAASGEIFIGKNNMSRLGILCQFYGKPEIIARVSKECFWPKPKIDSVIVKIIPNKTRMPDYFRKRFTKIVKAGFSHPRKQLLNNFRKNLGISLEQAAKWLLKNNIQPNQRAESLELEDWIKLAKSCRIY